MIPQLTKTENEILKLRCFGFIEKEIADKRHISHVTVKTHIRNAMRKTRYRSLYQLVAHYALENPNIFKDEH